MGKIRIELDAQRAPITTKNFLEYVSAGHYDGLIFHRVIPGFMIQGGGMLGTGWRCLDIIHLLEEDLQVPVVHPVPARVWAVQKRLHVRQPVKGYGRLLEQMP